MASRFFSQFKERDLVGSSPKGPATGPSGSTGEMAPKGPVTERTASWPDAGPKGPTPFNKTTKWPVVKTTAKKAGLS